MVFQGTFVTRSEPTGPRLEAAKAAVASASSVSIAPPAAAARARPRHWFVLFSFFLLVALPTGFVGFYLWTRAVNQFASTVGFSVRNEDTSSAIELLGGITELSGSSSSDTDVLYEFIQSQKVVADIDHMIDLRAIWSKPVNDPYYTFDVSGTIEDLVIFWDRFVRVSYDSGTGLIEVRVLAFDPLDATLIAQAIYDESSKMINALSDIAREDAIKYSEEELDRTVEQLKVARAKMTAFRNLHQVVDPTSSVGTQTSLIGNLQAQLAEALIELDLLGATTRASDPRITQANLKIKVIETRVSAERLKLGIGNDGEKASAFAELVGRYEALEVDRQFAENSYTGALAAYYAAQAEARRQSRYLAAHVLPTTAERSLFPERRILLGLFFLLNFLLWGITVLVIYSLKDRR